MRKIDTSEMVLVHYGREWPHPTPPCSKAMVGMLERNEPLVYWLQPAGRGEQEQIPALKLHDGFYTLSLRMMKAIWRHVRLRKGFHNLERAQLGGYKLRIPTVLLTEKMRTQTRFNTMRMNAQAVRAPPKNPMSAASKITKVVTDFFLPMAEGFVPAYTPLTQSPDAEEILLLEKIWEMFPDAMRTREEFVDRMGALYDSGRQRAGVLGEKRALEEVEGGDVSLLSGAKRAQCKGDEPEMASFTDRSKSSAK